MSPERIAKIWSRFMTLDISIPAGIDACHIARKTHFFFQNSKIPFFVIPNHIKIIRTHNNIIESYSDSIPRLKKKYNPLEKIEKKPCHR